MVDCLSNVCINCGSYSWRSDKEGNYYCPSCGYDGTQEIEEFKECEACKAKPGCPQLCPTCITRRTKLAIKRLKMTNRDELFELHRQLCEEALDIMKAKNADYTNHDVDDPLANFRIAHKQGHVKSVAASIFIRFGDKFTRISTLLQKDALVRDEGIHDTIRDAVNYLILLSYALEKEKDAAL